jgi:hypothetical protein
MGYTEGMDPRKPYMSNLTDPERELIRPDFSDPCLRQSLARVTGQRVMKVLETT